jgi:hypothetical protein
VESFLAKDFLFSRRCSTLKSRATDTLNARAIAASSDSIISLSPFSMRKISDAHHAMREPDDPVQKLPIPVVSAHSKIHRGQAFSEKPAEAQAKQTAT